MQKITKKVGLEGVHIHAKHGYYPEEQVLGTEFIVDLITEMPISTDDKDELQETVDYEILLRIINEEMAITRKLIETVAWGILEKTKVQFPFLEKITVRLKKTKLPVSVQIDNSVVEYIYINH